MNTPRPIRLVLNVDLDQIKLLMGAFENRAANELPDFAGRPRTLETLRAAVEQAGRLDCDTDDGAYFILKLAPVYRALLKFGADPAETVGGVWIAESDEEVADAEQAALAALEVAP